METSKSDPVDQPVRTARTIVHHYYNGTKYCSTQTVLLIFPFLQTNIASQIGQTEAREQAGRS